MQITTLIPADPATIIEISDSDDEQVEGAKPHSSMSWCLRAFLGVFDIVHIASLKSSIDAIVPALDDLKIVKPSDVAPSVGEGSKAVGELSGNRG